MSANLYRILDVDPYAEPVVIRSAYLALMRRYHPDQAGGDSDPRRAQEIGAAYEVLRDPDRRAAYDAGRIATVGPVAGAVALPEARVRGGALGRNAFIGLALATAGLAWWGLDRTAPAPMPATAPARQEPKVAQADVAVAPPTRKEEEVDLPPPPPVIEEELAPPVVVDVPLPMVAEVARARPEQRPEQRPERKVAARRAVAQPVVARRAIAQPAERSATTMPARSEPEAVDLTGLERHLRLLTDQSVRAGTGEERARIFATSGAFVARLNACASQACSRDAYLARNQEVAAIMRR